jgi:hypothetical protein
MALLHKEETEDRGFALHWLFLKYFQPCRINSLLGWVTEPWNLIWHKKKRAELIVLSKEAVMDIYSELSSHFNQMEHEFIQNQ